MRRTAALGAVMVMFCVACNGGNGSSSDGGVGGVANCTAYVVPPGTSLTSPAVSFRGDVMKLFNDSCGASSCHGTASAPAGGLFLGLESARGGDAATVHAGLVGHAAAELPAMMLVTAGDPEHSYLMHKLDGDQCMFTAQCSGGDCMSFMPQGSPQPLAPETRDVVRRWIATGAASD
jgi:hypothetical protein